MAKKLAVVFGIIFVLIGLLGFIDNPIVGVSENDPIFVADAIHNIVHLLVGVVLIVMGAKSNKAASTGLILFGIVYLVLFLDGLVQPEALLGFVGSNAADTWLHLVLGILLLVAGYATRKDDRMMIDQMAS